MLPFIIHLADLQNGRAARDLLDHFITCSVYSFHRWVNRGPERLCDLSKHTQLRNDWTGITTSVFWLLIQCSSYCTLPQFIKKPKIPPAIQGPKVQKLLPQLKSRANSTGFPDSISERTWWFRRWQRSVPTRSAPLLSLEMEEWKSSGHNGNKQMEWIHYAISKMAWTWTCETCVFKPMKIPKQLLSY